MRTWKQMVRWSFLCFVALFFSGCLLFVEDVECLGAGDVQITWLFEGVAACPADVTNVIVQVRDDNGEDVHRNPQGDEYICEDGFVNIPGLQCGEFQYRVQGIDDTDAFTWDSGWSSVRMFGGLTTVNANLHQIP